MIRDLFERVKRSLSDPGRSFKERVFIALTLVTVLVVPVVLVSDIMIGENIVEIITLIATMILVPIITIVSTRRKNMVLAVRLVVIGLVFIILPVIFYFGGGVEGGGIFWIIFAYLYTGLVLSGVWKMVMVVIITVEAMGFYLHGYFNPELVVQHEKGVYYTDSLMSLITVGIVCCLMVWFEEWLFQEENKRTKEETKKFEELNLSQNRFFSSMSHEIRTPINSILGLNEIILRQEDASDEIVKDAENIQGAGRLLLSLVNDILDVSKIEAGKMDIVPVNYSLAPMISEIVNMIWLRAEEKGLQLKVEIDPSIPVELFGDEVRIKQILVNLLNNAIKYTKEGSVTLHIEKEEVRGDQILLMFSVIDTGMGIKQDAIPYLFDAFQRVDEEKNAKIEGTGLGLSIVKQLVDLMDGKVTVNSVYTEGSTFSVALWQGISRTDTIGNISITSDGERKQGGKYRPGFTARDARILIVDDNEMNLEVEKKLLEGTQIQVDLARSGEEALSYTINEHYDVILMDHLMPQMDGIECMQRIRQQTGGLNNHVPVIVLTANAGADNRDLYNRSGFDGYLVKPVSGQQLEEMLVRHLPGMKVISSQDSDTSRLQMNTSRGYSKKIPVLITTGSACGLSSEVLEKYRIDTLPFIIHTEGRSFADRVETSTDELVRYMKAGVKFRSEPPTVEDFEKFFGRELKKTHQVIYIAVSSEFSDEYENATIASRAYGNVTVFDSGCHAGALGMLVLLAYRLASQGRTYERIIEELEVIKGHIRSSFLTDNALFLQRKGVIGKGMLTLINTLSLSSFVRIKGGRLEVERLFTGDAASRREKTADAGISRLPEPDLDVLYLEYAYISEEEQKSIEERIRAKYDFENIIWSKASSVMSLNLGGEVLCVSYLTKGDQPYSLGTMLSKDYEESDEAVEETPVETEEDEPEFPDPLEKQEVRWYEKIPGIDPKVAITNSGSEEALRTVLGIFYNSIDQKTHEIRDLFEKEDIENYTIKVHALKSSARLVGAVELGNEAEVLEFAGKNNEIEKIRELTPDLLSRLWEYKDRLAGAFEAPEERETESIREEELPEVEYNEEEFDRFLIESVYEAVREAAASGDADLISATLEEIADYRIPPEDEEKVESIRECLSNNDLEKIISVIDG